MYPAVLSLDWDFFVGAWNQQDGCEPCRECSRLKPLPHRRAKDRGSKLLRSFSDSKFAHREDKIPVIARMLTRKTVQRLVIAESHGRIRPLCPPKSVVYNLDLHPDNWRGLGLCASWASNDWNNRCGNLHKYRHVTRWTDMRQWLSRKRKLALVFLCRSSPHTARAQDKLFYKFVRRLSKACRLEPEFVGKHAKTLKAEYKRESSKPSLTRLLQRSRL